MSEVNQSTPVTVLPARAPTPSLNKALAIARAQIPPIPKDKTVTVKNRDGSINYEFDYADLGSIMEAIKKPLSENGLAIIHQIETQGSSMFLDTYLVHESGDERRSRMPLGNMGGRPQDLGGLLTYYRRYSAAALVGVASEEDDDGSAAAGYQRDVCDRDRGGSKKSPEKKQETKPQQRQQQTQPKQNESKPAAAKQEEKAAPVPNPPKTDLITRENAVELQQHAVKHGWTTEQVTALVKKFTQHEKWSEMNNFELDFVSTYISKNKPESLNDAKEPLDQALGENQPQAGEVAQ